jgi:3'(2'),5'-bisphosphate nucleotidase
MTDPARLRELLEGVGDLARRAGEAILATVDSVGDVEEKADGSPVTRADRAANDVLVEGLRKLEPTVVIVSEEGDLEATVRAAGSVYWLVDPLDGTKEFIAGRPEYTVNVALVEAGVPILGVIQVPVNGRLYLAARGVGAQLVDGETRTPLTPVAVDRPRRAVVSRSHLSPPTEEFLALRGGGGTRRRVPTVRPHVPLGYRGGHRHRDGGRLRRRRPLRTASPLRPGPRAEATGLPGGRPRRLPRGLPPCAELV